MIGSELAKMAATLDRIGKGPDLSHVNHHWRASTLESCGDHSIIRFSFYVWYITSDPLLIYMLILFDCIHKEVPRILCFDSPI